MDKLWLIALATGIFAGINLLFYVSMNGYVKKEFGKKMWLNWSHKMYFWQTSIIVSTIGTALILYLLKWTDIVNF